jgi:hypothetical protein
MTTWGLGVAQDAQGKRGTISGLFQFLGDLLGGHVQVVCQLGDHLLPALPRLHQRPEEDRVGQSAARQQYAVAIHNASAFWRLGQQANAVGIGQLAVILGAR